MCPKLCQRGLASMPSFFSKSYWFPTEEEVRSRLALYEDEIHVSRINEMDIEAGLQNLPPDDQEGFREMDLYRCFIE
jgi:hypothetical protein